MTSRVGKGKSLTFFYSVVTFYSKIENFYKLYESDLSIDVLYEFCAHLYINCITNSVWAKKPPGLKKAQTKSYCHKILHCFCKVCFAPTYTHAPVSMSGLSIFFKKTEHLMSPSMHYYFFWLKLATYF